MRRTALCFALLSAAGWAATPGFLLGVNYSEFGPYLAIGNTQQIAADASGALYVLSQCAQSETGNGPSCLNKYAADGKTLVWQNSLGVFISALAVDPNGGVYLSIPSSSAAGASNAIEKLGADGKTVLWNTPISGGGNLAVDATGRVFTFGASAGSASSPAVYGVIRLNTAGTIDATFPNLPATNGIPAGIAVDPTGSNILVAYDYQTFLESFEMNPVDRFARIGPDDATWLTFATPLAALAPAIAVAPNGDAVIYGTDLNGNRSLQRIDPSGAVVFTNPVPSETEPATSNAEAPASLALDAAGNAYITGYTGPYGYPAVSGAPVAYGTPVRNSLAPCGSAWLGVYAPDGSVLQITYLPGATSTPFAFGTVVTGGSSVYVVDVADTTFTPTQTGPFPRYPLGPQSSPASLALYNLSQNSSAQTVPLACVASAASFLANVAIAPGELLALYGNSLGPPEALEPPATLETPFPTQAGGTQVTFDGIPAPLLWVQDSQVNVAVPWSVTGPTTKICVTYNNVPTNCLTEPVAQFAPGVFTVDGLHAAALNQDGTVNSASNPAPLNSIVSIWATGTGPISPPAPDGSLVAPPLPDNAYPAAVGFLSEAGIGGIEFFVPTTNTYAGPAPLLVAGTTQINFQLGGDETSTTYFTVGAGATQGAGVPTSNAFLIYIAGQ
jgi:uncharacterized protein (TIGR03437 family)